MSTKTNLLAALQDAHDTLGKIFEHPCSNASGNAPTNIATLAFLGGSRARAAIKTASEAACDPAAVFGIAASLDAWASGSKFKGNVSEAYEGADQFMREIMKTGTAFETWASANVDFTKLDDVWPYLLQDKFAAALEAARPGGVLILNHLTDADWPAVAAELKLTLKTEGGK